MMDAWSEIYFFPFLHLKGSSYNNLHQQLEQSMFWKHEKNDTPRTNYYWLDYEPLLFSSALTPPQLPLFLLWILPVSSQF
jgi:hypothetical protein